MLDKSRVYTALNADKLKVGSKVIVADTLLELKECILKHKLPKILNKIEPENFEYRFLCDDGFHYSLAYIPEKQMTNEWHDLRKDPCDLPNSMRNVWTNVGPSYYDLADHCWRDEFGRTQGVIAWCEPKFEE